MLSTENPTAILKSIKQKRKEKKRMKMETAKRYNTLFKDNKNSTSNSETYQQAWLIDN
jgi:hypothetical protein